MKKSLVIAVLLVIGLALFFPLLNAGRNPFLSGTALPTKDFAQIKPSYMPLIATAQRYGRVSIIVGFHVSSAKPSQEEIAQGRQQLLDKLAGYQAEISSDLLFVPYITMTVDEPTLRYLIGLPEVTSVDPNQVNKVDLEIMPTRTK